MRCFLAMLMVLVMSGVSHADSFRKVSNKAIKGYDTRVLRNVSVRQCKRACLEEMRFYCKSFDYDKRNRSCALSDVRAREVGGLKRFSGNRYDHYIRIVSTPARTRTSAPSVRLPGKGNDVVGAINALSGLFSTLAKSKRTTPAPRRAAPPASTAPPPSGTTPPPAADTTVTPPDSDGDAPSETEPSADNSVASTGTVMTMLQGIWTAEGSGSLTLTIEGNRMIYRSSGRADQTVMFTLHTDNQGNPASTMSENGKWLYFDGNWAHVTTLEANRLCIEEQLARIMVTCYRRQ